MTKQEQNWKIFDELPFLILFFKHQLFTCFVSLTLSVPWLVSHFFAKVPCYFDLSRCPLRLLLIYRK